jgi:hypothetical protein
MTAGELLKHCRTLGIDLVAGPDGSLVWEADADPPAELLATLVQHKAELLALLAPGTGPAVTLIPTDDATLARFLERDLGLPAGTLELYRPPRGCRSCDWCLPGGPAGK